MAAHSMEYAALGIAVVTVRGAEEVAQFVRDTNIVIEEQGAVPEGEDFWAQAERANEMFEKAKALYAVKVDETVAVEE